MALEENMVMPVGPFGNNSGFGGDFGAWIILFLIFGMFGGGWGNNFGGNNALSYDFPWLMNGQNGINQNTNEGFQNAAIQSAIGDLRTGVTAGFGDVALGIAGINQNICQTGNSIGNQIFGISSQLSQCCCENRLASEQVKNVVQTEGAATRLAIQNQTQEILDKMCQQEIDALKAQNLALQNQVNMQALAASQTAQTAALVADNTAQTQYIVNRVAPYPIPAYTVANPVTPAT